MNAREFYCAVVRMRSAQRLQEKISSERNKNLKIELETIVDNEIERVTKIEMERAKQAQRKLL